MGEFHTFEGYSRMRKGPMSKSLEDYMEMIYRITKKTPVVRIKQLAEALNVNDSSVSRMVRQLGNLGYIEYKPYEYIRITEKGRIKGEYLLKRHNIVNRLLCYINDTENELEQTELIEHHLNETTVKNIERLLDRLEEERHDKQGGI